MLGFALELAAWLHQDQQRPQRERHRRDRSLATENDLGTIEDSSAARLRALVTWWRAVPRGEHALPIDERRVERTRTLLSVALFVLGLVLGSGVAGAALRYDGTAPVNLIGALAWLVFLPGIFLLLSLVLLPGRIPLAGWLQDILATLSPGQWASQWMNRRFRGLDLGWRSQNPRYLGDSEPVLDLPGLARLAKWQMLLFSQQLATGYALGAVGTLIGLIAFTDMAFGWSTTLDVPSGAVADGVRWLSQPWGWLWPAAAPSLELVENSRFFRAAGIEAAVAPQLGRWWPFLLMTLLVYGVLPRLLLLWFARRRLRAAEHRLLLRNPAVDRLLQRLTTPLAEHHRPPPEEGRHEGLPQAMVAAPSAPALELDGELQVIVWNDAIDATGLEGRFPAIEAGTLQPLELGSTLSLAQEQASLAALPETTRLVVFAKAWEPPLLEFQDLLLRLAERLKPAGRVLVVPVGVAGGSATEGDLAVWRQTLQLLDDVRLQLWDPPS
ncbi:MAG: DUF2868 domain-containing protein [Pseudomonadota bacterium]